MGECDGEAFMVMEFVEGRSLRELIGSDGLPLQVAIRYGVQIADAVAHAHDRGILHRDLKTGNVMITSDGRVKVLDFGLARRLTQQDLQVSSDTTATLEVAQVTGTLAYMAPELLEGDPADARSDVWSLGVVLFETVAGTLPFSGRTSAELSAAILRGGPKALPAAVPAGLRGTVLRCLSREPVKRYGHAREVAAALETIGQDIVTPGFHRRDTQGIRGPSARATLLTAARRVGWRTAAAAAIGAVMLGAFWWLSEKDRPLRTTSNRLVTSLPPGSSAASFSPDGTMVVFQTSDAGEAPQLWIKNLAQGEPLQITSVDPGATRACWSPKGDRILFNHRGGIWSVPPLGGHPHSLIERASNPSFSRDGEHIAYETPDRGIWLANADGSNARRLTSRDQLWEATPALSPDGDAVAYFQNEIGPMGDFWVIPTSGGPPRRLTFDHSHGGKPAWTPDGRSVIVSSMRRGSENLWQVPASGGPPEPVTFGAGQDRDPAISADGRHLVYTNTRVAYALILFDRATGRETELLERRSPMDLPRFSNKGNRIAFFHQVDADLQLFTIAADGQQLRQVTHSPGHKNLSPQWSADDSFLFFTRYRPDISFRRVSVGGGDSVELGPWGVLNWPEVDPSGRAVIYQRLDGAQDVATVIREFTTGTETVVKPMLREVRWSRDGQTILGHDPVSSKVVSCSAPPRTCQVITSGHTPRPSGDGSRIFFLRPTNPRSRSRELWSIGRDGRDERRIGTLGPFYIDVRFDVSRHDQIVFVQYRETPAELWRAALH